jgi:type IV pilus assembly protein PilY1
VLLASGGAGGGFYYALDVTDPKAPKFLWQLSTDSSGVPLFGSSVPTPAIATIALKDGLEVKEVPVAILPGGSSPLLPGTCPRKQTSWPNIEAAFPPRTSVRCWGTGTPPSHVTGPGRSITIARLDNGKIIMNLRRDAADGPALKLGTNRKDGIPFDSPLTGIPIPYPAQTGQIANRVYIGDADGTLWRINLADPDPTKWSVEIAWDAYSHSSDSALGGQPIQTPPVLSVDPIGNLVMLFSTGDQEVFTNSAGVKTRIWSVTEEPGFKTKSNWVIPFENGMRVTGPISLFNSVAYFSTFNPAVANICSDGDSWVWGVDYRQKANGTGTSPEAGWPLAVNTFNRYPKRAFPIDANNPSNLAYTKTFPEAIVFGVSVTQTPTCTETTNTNDPYFGQHTAVSKAAAGEFQLVFQTGPKAGSQAQGAKTNTITQALPAPRLSTRVDSWASIVE